MAGLPAKSEQEIIQAGQHALDKGVEICLISHDITGDLLITRDGVWDLQARVPLSKFKNLVGADDALVGAFLYRLSEGDDVLEAVRFGMAAAIASAEIEPKMCLSKPAIELEMEQVEIVRKEGG
ncbi:hypothetical protein DRJ54_05075 [Candidatus Acetothermia bacterium]|nr:MAG: hypothetical protein DRJ54_05075 [Candidatus Acetothermia bacterium]